MNNFEFDESFKTERERLLRYYERINKKSENLSEIQIIARFLLDQSIGTSNEEILNILNYFKNKLVKNINTLDFAFEWIRAQKIRLNYKKHLIRTNYPNNNLNLAIDDCITHFFLEYDDYFRKLFKKEILEHEISTLYSIFFSPYEAKKIDVARILAYYKDDIPTIFQGENKINTNIFTLRAGLSRLILYDYKRVLNSRKEEKKKKEGRDNKEPREKEDTCEFGGARMQRMVRTYCITKKELEKNEIEGAISQFLSPYFRFGNFFNYEDFKELLIQSFAENFLSGVSDNVKTSYHNLDTIKELTSKELADFREIHKIQVLDGLAWINDMKKNLIKLFRKLIDNIDESKQIKKPQEIEISYKIPTIPKIKKKKPNGENNFAELFDISMEIDEYRTKLEELVDQSDLSLIQKRMMVRTKVHEFTMEKRKSFKRH